MKNDFKKIIFVLVYILSIILLVYLCSFTYSIFLNKLSVENYFTTNTIFSINKIVLFSSANAEVTVNTNNTTTINNLIQYTDIAIFINNNTSEYTLENTLKSVQIDDIKFNTLPKSGKANLYYKDLNLYTFLPYTIYYIFFIYLFHRYIRCNKSYNKG